MFNFETKIKIRLKIKKNAQKLKFGTKKSKSVENKNKILAQNLKWSKSKYGSKMKIRKMKIFFEPKQL